MAKASGDVITHCNAVRTRIEGSGNLVTVLADTGTKSELLTNGVLIQSASKAINQLANFKVERISVEIRVMAKDDWFEVSNMWAYIRESAASYPQI